MKNPALAGLHEPLRMLLNLHYRYRFDPPGLSDEDRAALKARDAGLFGKFEPGQALMPFGDSAEINSPALGNSPSEFACSGRHPCLP